ncbi:MAG: hypothetical protein ACREO5_07750, partial [Candidatus Binatia bacterium]
MQEPHRRSTSKYAEPIKSRWLISHEQGQELERAASQLYGSRESGVALGMTMTAIIRFAFIATMLVASNPDPTALAQAALQAPNDHVAPLTFDAGVRALNA